MTASYTYDLNGNRASMSYNNGLQETYAYNQANLVTQVVNKKGTSVLSQYDYTYDLSGQQVSKTDHTGKITSYTYDDQGQLTGETETLDGVQVHQYSYQYDPAYNRVQATLDGKTVSYITDANNRLLSSTDEAGATTYTYDANGNTKSVSYAGLDKTVQYGYDGLDRQTSVGSVSYAYYPGGLRSSKTVGGTTTTYVWDGDQLVLEQTGDTVKKYIRGLNLIAQQEGSALTYYLYNAHGDVVQLCDESGDIIRSYDYDAFGVEKASSTDDTNPFRYCGEYFDGETGSYYLRARNYVPILGRFTQEDPAMDGWNWYIYCAGNPVTHNDPTGMMISNDGFGYQKYDKNSDIYRILDDIAERAKTADSIKAKDYYTLAEKVRRLADEGTPVQYAQDKVMNELHKNARQGIFTMCTLRVINPYEPVLRGGAYLAARTQISIENLGWDYKRQSDWQVPYQTYDGLDMNVDNNKNWIAWMYFDGELIAGDDFGNINMAYVGYSMGLPEWVYANFATLDGKDAKWVLYGIELAKEGR